MQNWKFQDRIFFEQAQCPTVLKLDDCWRIYFSQRDMENRSLPYYIDVEPGNPSNIISEKVGPLLSLGKPGTFDHFGVIPSSVVKLDDLAGFEGQKRIYMYYVGWSVRKDVPYHNTAGVAYSYDNGKTFVRASEGPMLSTNSIEPYFNGTTCVMPVNNDLWLNWYMSCTGWIKIKDKLEPRYHLKMAMSEDGVNWDQAGVAVIDFSSDLEGGISKASVIKNVDGYKMWYSYRGLHEYRTNWDNSYKIGYAESINGFVWERKDDQVAIKSGNSFDHQMQCYPCVIKYENKLFMFYNGNNCGKTGFGYATLSL